MSLATLKKKTAHKYQNNSVNQSQFSINGGYRNQGYVGQTSDSRTILRTPAKGTESQGHGGCCGTYLRNDVRTSSICSTENNRVIKPSVLGTKGMLQKRTQWARRPAQDAQSLLVKPGDGSHLSSGSDYIVYKRKNAIIDAATSRAFTVTFQSIGRQNNKTSGYNGTDVYILVDDIQIAQITPVQNEYTDHSITFYQCKDTEKFTFTLKGEEGLSYFHRTGIANLKINGVSIINYYNYTTSNVENNLTGVVNAVLSNTGTTGVPPDGNFPTYPFYFFNRDNNNFPNTKYAIVPSLTNPFIIVAGNNNGITNDDSTVTNHYHIKEFSASLFPVLKSYKEGSKCCEKTVQTNTSLGALTQGDYIYQRISECTNFDLSYVQYNQTHSLPLNTCHAG